MYKTRGNYFSSTFSHLKYLKLGMSTKSRNWYSNIRIGYSNIFYAQQTHYDDLLGGTCIENMRYMYMHGIVSGLYQWHHIRKSANFAQKIRQSGGV